MNKQFKKALLLAAIPLMGFALFYLIPYLFVVRYSVNIRGSHPYSSDSSSVVLP